MTTSRYRAYGLTILSPLELPLPAANVSEEDVRIRVLPASAEEVPAETLRHRWKAEPDRFDLWVDGIARFVVENGCSITIHPSTGAQPDDLVAFVLSSALGALLQQRRMLPLHASAVAAGQGAIVMLGKSGAGKSTTMATLVARGFAMVTDDIAAIEQLPGGAMQIVPAYPSSRLWEDAVAKLHRDSNALARVRQGIGKFYLPIDRFSDRPQPIAGIVLLQVHNRPDIEIERVSASAAFGLLSQFTFRKRFLKGQGLLPMQFAMTTRLATTAPMVIVRRPVAPFTADAVADAIVTHFAVHPAEAAISA